MKKGIVLVVAAILCVSLCACSDYSGSDTYWDPIDFDESTTTTMDESDQLLDQTDDSQIDQQEDQPLDETKTPASDAEQEAIGGDGGLDPSIVQPDSYYAEVEYVVSDPTGVNVRTKPSTTGDILCTLEKGAVVYASATEGDWVYVNYIHQGYGWAHTSCLSRVSKDFVMLDEADEFDREIDLVVTDPTGANMRSGPSTSYSVIDTIPYQSEIVGIGRKNDWYYVGFGGDVAWVSASCVSAAE